MLNYQRVFLFPTVKHSCITVRSATLAASLAAAGATGARSGYRTKNPVEDLVIWPPNMVILYGKLWFCMENCDFVWKIVISYGKWWFYLEEWCLKWWKRAKTKVISGISPARMVILHVHNHDLTCQTCELQTIDDLICKNWDFPWKNYGLTQQPILKQTMPPWEGALTHCSIISYHPHFMIPLFDDPNIQYKFFLMLNA